jgi:hypothetical protein
LLPLFYARDRVFCIYKIRTKWTFVVYNKQEELISTFLPLDNLENYYRQFRPSMVAFLKKEGLIMSDEEWLETKKYSD